MSEDFPFGKIVGVALALPFLFLVSLIILIVVILGHTDTNVGDTLAYLTPINQIAKIKGVPPTWAVADIAWESGGYWKAVNTNSNGTTDAGLCQINSVNWPTYNLVDDPFDVIKNINAGESILGNAFARYHNIEDALYAYNAGTPENGRLYNPEYVPNVSKIHDSLISSQLIISAHSYNDEGLILTVGESTYEKGSIGSDNETSLINPLYITVQVANQTGTIKLNTTVYPSNGDGLDFPEEATIYKVVGTSFSKGDKITVKSSSGSSNQISLEK